MQGFGVNQRTLFHDDTAAGPAGSGKAVFPAPEFGEKTTLQTEFFFIRGRIESTGMTFFPAGNLVNAHNKPGN